MDSLLKIFMSKESDNWKNMTTGNHKGMFFLKVILVRFGRNKTIQQKYDILNQLIPIEIHNFRINLLK